MNQLRIGQMALVLVIISRLLVGCSEKADEVPKEVGDKNIATIQTVIEKEFGGPNESYIKLWNNQWDQVEREGYESSKAEQQALSSYAHQTYEKYFTENGLTNFLSSTPAFLYQMIEGDYALKAVDIDIQQEKTHPTIYQFTFKAELTDKDGKVTMYLFEGEAICPEEGKIGKLMFGEEVPGALSAKLMDIENLE